MAEQQAERKWFKGGAALGLDAWYGGDAATSLEKAREWLLSNESFEELARRLNADAPEIEYDFSEYPPNCPLEGPRFETVTRQGYLEAIGLALAHTPPVPIKTYWMTGAGNDEFEMHISDDAQHVTVTVLVPDVDGGDEDPQSPESWVVTIDADGKAQSTQRSGPPGREQPSNRGTG